MPPGDDGLLFTDMEPPGNPTAGAGRVGHEGGNAAAMHVPAMPTGAIPASFEQGARQDPETLELKRTIRMLRRHWLGIAVCCLFFGVGMYVYDVMLYELLGRMHVSRSMHIGARKVFRATLMCEYISFPGNFSRNSLTAFRFDPETIHRLPSRPQFRKNLDMQLRVYAESEPGLSQRLKQYLKKPLRASDYKITMTTHAGNLISISVTGENRHMLPVIAGQIVPAMNQYARQFRVKRINANIDDLRQLIADNEKALDRCWQKLSSLNARMRMAGSGTAERNIELDNLEKERHELQIKDEKLHIHLEYFKQKCGYQALARKFFVQNADDVSKLAVEGNVLRSEWARLELELTKLRTRYTDQHPRIVAIVSDIIAIKRKLLQTGGATSMGRLPPIPKRSELEFFRQVAAMEDKIALNRTELAVIQRKISGLKRKLLEQRKEISQGEHIQKLERKRDDLTAEIHSLRAKRMEAINRVAELEIEQNRIKERNDFSVVAPAKHLELVSPRVWLDLVMALLFGAILGSGLAFIRGSLDNYLHTPNDIFYHLRLNYLGVIPFWKERQGKLIDPLHPVSGIADVYAHLCNNIRFGRGDSPEKCLLVASALPGEGKSTISVNLAIRYAMEGNSALLIDADMRRRREKLFFAREPEAGEIHPGLAGYLAREATLEEVVQSTEITGLSFLPSGKLPRNPTKLLRDRHMQDLLVDVQQRYDIVIIDCPAVLPVVDATIVAPSVRGVLVAVAANEADIGSVRMALHRLQHVGAPVIGAVLNKVRDRSASTGYYGYGYSYGYGDR